MSNSISKFYCHLGELATHSLFGAASGSAATKLLGLGWSQGAAAGLVMGTANGLAQKTLAYFTSIEETPAFRIGVSVAMLAAVLLTANTSLGLSLLGRVGVSLSPNAFMTLGLSTFISECGLALVPQPKKKPADTTSSGQPIATSSDLKVYNWNDSDLQKVNNVLQDGNIKRGVKKLSKTELSQIFKKFDRVEEFIQTSDDLYLYINGGRGLMGDLIPNFLESFIENKLYTPPKTKDEVEAAPKHVIRHFFGECYLPEDEEAKQAYLNRLEQLRLPYPIPSKANGKYFNIWDFNNNKAQLRWIWKYNYNEFIQHLPEDKRDQLDQWILDDAFSKGSKSLQYTSDVAKLTDSKLRLIAHNYHKHYEGNLNDAVDAKLKEAFKGKKIEIRPKPETAQAGLNEVECQTDAPNTIMTRLFF